MTETTLGTMGRWGCFSSNPRVEFLDDGRRVRVCETFTYQRASGQIFTVPQGFTCDGASIPRILWPLSGGPFEGRHRDAALVHDVLYAEGMTGTPIVDRATADRIFYEAQRCCGVPWVNAVAKYLAVRCFGPRW